MNPVHPRIPCAMFGWNLLSDSIEEEEDEEEEEEEKKKKTLCRQCSFAISQSLLSPLGIGRGPLFE